MSKEITIYDTLLSYIEEKNAKAILGYISEMEAVDIANFFEQLNNTQREFLYELMDNELSAEMLLYVDEEERKDFLKNLSTQEIAEEIIGEIDSDDAADIISELPEEQQNEILKHLDDDELAHSIVELLRYEEGTAGSLMATELVKIDHNLSIIAAVKEMRKLAEDMDEVYSIYVVDDHDKLLGLLSLKKLLTTSTSTKISEVYNSKIRSIQDTESAEDVARYMQKYDLFEVPVVDVLGKLVGRITIDDVMDFVKEEAEKDYQMASGIAQDIDSTDTIFNMTKARLPWLLIGMMGGLVGSRVLQGNEHAMQHVPELIFFVPLIAATAGNIGVQASAIIVQGVSAASGAILALIILGFNLLVNQHDTIVAVTISVSLLTVIIVAAIIGTIIPIFLNKNKIDPAIATGPFITTSNDILGVMIYFSIAKILLSL